MKSNLEKWKHYSFILKNKEDIFAKSQLEGGDIPDKYYYVYPSGKLVERVIERVEYYHGRHGGRTFFSGKKPTRDEVNTLSEYAMSDIPFDVNNLFFGYSEVWDDSTGSKSRSSVKFNDLINEVNLFHSLPEAEEFATNTIANRAEELAFRELHKKDSSYNYASNGYKFLGWQNGWAHVYYDEDGNLCSESGKQRRSFGYTTETHPEYGKCRDLKHKWIEVSHNRQGSENTVSCPICMIYWKYDCSD